MKLSVYSLKKILFQGEAELLNCKTMVGEITVLNHHCPLISILVAGVVRILDKNKKDYYFPINSGFLEVKTNNEARLIVEQ